MKNRSVCLPPTGLAVAICVLFVLSNQRLSAASEPAPRMLAHDVYFTLKNKSKEAKAELVGACRKYLADHPGTVWFAAGELVDEHRRDVNDRDFDVALHIVFKDKASHDTYQDAPRHHRFIQEHRDNWETVRVFDSWVDVSSHGQVTAEGKAAGTLELTETRQERRPMLYVQEAQSSVDVVAKKLEAAAAANQFGVLGVHDLKQKMNAKGVQFEPECRIVEVCNPKKAQSVLQADMSISNALPCRISIYQEGGRVKVSTLRPTAVLGLFGRPELEPVAKEVEETMIRMIDAACN